MPTNNFPGNVAANYPTGEGLISAMGGDPESAPGFAGLLGSPDPGDLGKMAARMVGEGGLLSAMTLFHGTPHKFNKFSLDAIGTGEGAQAYGHGLYFAENPGVASSYKTAGNARIARFEQRLSPNAEFAADFIEQGYSDTDILDMFAKSGRSDFDGAMAAIDEAKQAGATAGHLYEVEIPDEITDKMLDWDAPLSEQPELMARLNNLVDDGLIDSSRVQEIIRGPKIAGGYYEGYEIGKASDLDLWEGDAFFGGTNDNFVIIDPNGDFVRQGFGDIEFFDDADEAWSGLEDIVGESIERGGYGDATGKDLYEALQSDLSQKSPEAASRALNELGIPGIRFYDGNSRAAGEGTRNIVVFNPDDITQVKRDGEVVFER